MYHVGIDVSKAKLDVCLLSQDINGKRKNKSLPNNHQSAAKLIEWLILQKCSLEQTYVVMEATGVYHEILLYALHNEGLHVSLANPARVRSFTRGMDILTKNDGVDAYAIACYSLLKRPDKWTPPPEEVCILKALLRHRDALMEDVLRVRNRYEKAGSTTTSPIVLASLVKIRTQLEAELAEIERLISEHIDNHPGLKDDMKLLNSIKAVGPQLGRNMLVILRSYHFTSAEQAAAYLGVVPIERQSGSSVRGRPKLSKAGPSDMRKKLFMAALTAIKYNPHIKAHYERLTGQGKSKMSALGAAMRKLVHLCYGVLHTQKNYDENYA
ncbi:IS110 family transposase [Serratia quinivorans]|uniref:IS110 family transposase n=2 Tax=Serratia quinivorans TaxID=137545 RepID=UPI000FB3D5A7|nr:IS110 family transposase [Serratia quinivorans]MBV6695460.1 IS110 family transposase [Serratia quinivorans]